MRIKDLRAPIAAVCLLMAACAAPARQQQPSPGSTAPAATSTANAAASPRSADTEGEYATEGGWGHLNIVRTATGAQAFELHSVTGDAVCDLRGQLQGDTGETDASPDACRIRFAHRGDGFDLTPLTRDTCQDLCDYNASFDGQYIRLPIACATTALGTTRKKFQQLYDRHAYRDARDVLAPAFTRCQRFVDWGTEADIRNDLAVTYHKLGMRAACLKILAPYRKAAKGTDDEAIEGWTPSLADAWLGIVKTARTNFALCEKLPK